MCPIGDPFQVLEIHRTNFNSPKLAGMSTLEGHPGDGHEALTKLIGDPWLKRALVYGMGVEIRQ